MSMEEREQRMAKRMKAAALAGLLVLTLCACGRQGGEEKADVDLTALCGELTALCGEDLYELDEDTAKSLYGDLDTEQALVWSSSGATADEVALFQAADADGAEAVLAAVQQRVEDRRESYADYMPDEAAKLEKAIAEQHGTYVVLCACPEPDQAREIMDRYFG